MNAPGHQMFGFTWGILTLTLFNASGVLPADFAETLLFFALVLTGALIPDIDKYNSRIGRKFRWLSVPVQLVFGHRKFTHSLLFALLAYLLVSWAAEQYRFTQLYAVGLTAGIMSHIAGDFLTKDGVPLFYPFVQGRLRFIITFRTGSSAERVLVVLLAALNVYLLIKYAGNGAAGL
ncbi:metal-dependent hydrolase [Bacillus marinisedimentorum]|uniref:metal-dependent hydrolase n=1 Tax=Bacillus marinisedimentorum TaxID=1821260 RepID=UPI0007E26E72|nr:metal-dependent hydrolase [Bacillus marinisedimentorum]